MPNPADRADDWAYAKRNPAHSFLCLAVQKPASGTCAAVGSPECCDGPRQQPAEVHAVMGSPGRMRCPSHPSGCAAIQRSRHERAQSTTGAVLVLDRDFCLLEQGSILHVRISAEMLEKVAQPRSPRRRKPTLASRPLRTRYSYPPVSARRPVASWPRYGNSFPPRRFRDDNFPVLRSRTWTF
jgi:hypothetical protein